MTLPPALREDEQVLALAKTAAQQLQRTAELTNRTILYPRIDELTESLLDILGYDLRVDWYDTDYSVDVKRQIIKSSSRVHRLKGTPAAIEQALGDIFPGAQVEEWFEYGGEPYRFQVVVDTDNMHIESAQKEQALAKIRFYKNIRSHLEVLVYRFQYDFLNENAAHLIPAAMFRVDNGFAAHLLHNDTEGWRLRYALAMELRLPNSNDIAGAETGVLGRFGTRNAATLAQTAAMRVDNGYDFYPHYFNGLGLFQGKWQFDGGKRGWEMPLALTSGSYSLHNALYGRVCNIYAVRMRTCERLALSGLLASARLCNAQSAQWRVLTSGGRFKSGSRLAAGQDIRLRIKVDERLKSSPVFFMRMHHKQAVKWRQLTAGGKFKSGSSLAARQNIGFRIKQSERLKSSLVFGAHIRSAQTAKWRQITIGGRFRSGDCMEACQGIGFCLKTRERLESSLISKCRIKTKVRLESKEICISIGMRNRNNLKAYLTIDTLWMFDGVYRFDGERRFNAAIIRSEI